MLFAASLASLGIAFAVDRAAADLWVDLTSCDQELVDGTSCSHVRFVVHNAGNLSVYRVLMFPSDPSALQDTCHTFTIDQLPNWSGSRRPDGGAGWGTPPGSNAQIAPGKTLGGFGATLSGTHCCFRFTLTNALGEPSGSSVYCFQCDLPSTTAQSTWGALKAVYR